jgi:CRISPR-associated protein Cas1
VNRELSHHLVGKRKAVEFKKPSYMSERDDSDLLRKKIVDMSYTEWKKMGFSKGTLHYMKQNAKADKPFTLNAHVRERFERWGKQPNKLSI